MADIAGVSAFGFGGVRSNPAAELEQAAEESRDRRTEEDRRQEATEEALRSGDTSDADASRVAQEADTEQDTNTRNEQRQNDEVVLSTAAQDRLANDNADDGVAVAAAGETAAVGETLRTNQEDNDNANTSEVNGNQDQESEQTRTLGQVVDQFA